MIQECVITISDIILSDSFGGSSGPAWFWLHSNMTVLSAFQLFTPWDTSSCFTQSLAFPAVQRLVSHICREWLRWQLLQRWMELTLDLLMDADHPC